MFSYTANISHQCAPADFCLFHWAKISGFFTVYRLCYWGHRWRVEHLHFNFFYFLWKFYFLLTRDLILCSSRSRKTLFETVGSRNLSVYVNSASVLPHGRCNLFVLQYWVCCHSKWYFFIYLMAFQLIFLPFPSSYLITVASYKELLFLVCKLFRSSSYPIWGNKGFLLCCQVCLFYTDLMIVHLKSYWTVLF